MKKKILLSILCFAILIVLLFISILITKPVLIKEFKDTLVNTKNTIEVKNSQEYKNLKSADKSKKYYKDEKNIKIPILLYHQIPTKKSKREDYYVCTTAKQFEKQISGLKDLGYTFITYEDLVKYNNNEIPLPEYVVLLSFDDGYLDNYENAFPIVKKYNIPINIFVIDDCVGSSGYFSWKQAKEMEESGLVHIYTHGKVHIPYGNESADTVKEYISYAHKHLEEELGHETLKVFAYPYGSCSDDSINALSELKFIQNLLGEQYNTSDSLNLNKLTRIYAKQNYNVYSILKLILF
ncbi:MAG: polysaccharide deacetylase family protein [Clostridia bacterium]|nr:polysaccharide deacetylase family protein [Clostridia bacterium]